MSRAATKANEVAQALGKLGATMKAIKWPVPNASGKPTTEAAKPL